MKKPYTLLPLFAVAMLFVLPPISAVGVQHRPDHARETHHRSPAAVPKLPPGHHEVVVHGTPFFHHAGVFYRPGPRGYVVVPAPIGARVSVLPTGYLTFHIGAVDFFYYFGAYYRWDPAARLYVVVEPPAERPSTDMLYLVSGEVLHGNYLGGDANSIRFAVGNEIHQIPLTEIVSLQLQPPFDS